MTIPEQLRSPTGMIELIALAEILGSHKQTLYKACRKGTMPQVRVGSRVKFDPHVIAAWIEQRQVG